MTSLGAIVLAGGGGSRLGGVLKPAIRIGGERMLDRVLAALTDADPIVVVAPETLNVPSGVVRIMEDPPGGGPVAAISAALQVQPLASRDFVAIMAGDMPLLRAPDVIRIASAVKPRDDGALYVDETGRAQWLCGVWRTATIVRAIDELRVTAGGSVRALLGPLAVTEVHADGAGLPPYFDCDTDDDIRRAEEWLRS
jgi:molybdopterin-guanine dinucleotide biosynthesis protein A